VKVKGKPKKEELQRLSRGIRLEDGITAPCAIAPLRETEGNTWVEMVLHQGKNRQLKRMWEKLGYPVLKLKRVGFGGLKLGSLQPGEYRLLRPEEVQKLKNRASSSAPKIPPPASRSERRIKRGEGGR
jgi:23S rRNA pseudouridine2605 synthase